jgi:hypothetical protein
MIVPDFRSRVRPKQTAEYFACLTQMRAYPEPTEGPEAGASSFLHRVADSDVFGHPPIWIQPVQTVTNKEARYECREVRSARPFQARSA